MRLATYIRIAIKSIPTEIVIHMTDQKSAGMPVAADIFSASVGIDGAKGEDRKNTVFRSSSAFRMH